MKKYNALIIGAGGQGALADAPGSGNEHKIISFAKAFKEHPGFELVGIADKNHDAANDARQIWGIKWWTYGNNSHDLFFLNNGQDFEIDIAIVATPDDTHYEILKQLAEYPLKLVICEKPLCTDLQQAREIVSLYKAKGIPLMVDNTRNYIPCLRNLTKEHGKAVAGYCLFNRGWLHTAIHAIGFFSMLDLENYRIKEIKDADHRIWSLVVVFEDDYIWSEERITNDMPVPEYLDLHMQYVINNAYNFLDGREELIYTGEMALKDLETCVNLMNNMI